jgi:phosphoribosylaminoimidazole carboxylase PurE protein
MEETVKVLEAFAIPHEIYLTSAHRTPERTAQFTHGAAKRGVRVIIAGAGAGAHLAGVIASQTLLPVIGVPIDATSLQGLDSLFATVQMPGGIPVATMAIGKAGAKNAALFAVRILALEDADLLKKLQAYVRKMAQEVERKPETPMRKNWQRPSGSCARGASSPFRQRPSTALGPMRETKQPWRRSSGSKGGTSGTPFR